MRVANIIRWSAAVTIGVGAAITMLPAAGAFAAGPTTTTHATIAQRAAQAFLPRADAPREHAAASRAATDHVVNISSKCNVFCFAPAQITIAAGDTVTWMNTTDAEHIVARCAPSACTGVNGGTGTDATFTSAMLTMPPGASSHFTFTQPGTYVYYCTLHGYALMHGTITVTPAAPTTPPASVGPPPATTPAVVAPAQPQLADTGAAATGALAVGFALILCGLTATTFQRRRRLS
jgi:plastocyanin